MCGAPTRDKSEKRPALYCPPSRDLPKCIFTGVVQIISLVIQALCHQEKRHRYPLNRNILEAQNRTRCFGGDEESFPLPKIAPRSLQPSDYIDYAIPGRAITESVLDRHFLFLLSVYRLTEIFLGFPQQIYFFLTFLADKFVALTKETKPQTKLKTDEFCSHFILHSCFQQCCQLVHYFSVSVHVHSKYSLQPRNTTF